MHETPHICLRQTFGPFGNPQQVVIQIMAVAATALYAFVGTYVLLKILSFFMPLRVESHEEEAGLDASTHGESAYRM